MPPRVFTSLLLIFLTSLLAAGEGRVADTITVDVVDPSEAANSRREEDNDDEVDENSEEMLLTAVPPRLVSSPFSILFVSVAAAANGMTALTTTEPAATVSVISAV